MSAARPPQEADLVVVGGGIVGLATARELLARRPGAKLAVLEREDTLGAHQTTHSSGVIHAGIYYAPGSLKARLCVEGARDLYAYCEERGITAERNGKLIVATDPSEIDGLDELERRGTANGVPGLRRLAGDEISDIEPNAQGVAALHSPNTGVVDFGTVAEAYAEDVRAAGGAIATSTAVTAITAGDTGIELRHGDGTTRAGFAVFCAGGWSDRLAVMAGAPKEPRIVPFRGNYLKLSPDQTDLVRGNVYPVPDPDLPFLGAHLTKSIRGEVLLGPSALLVGGLGWPGTWRVMLKHRRAGIRELRHAINRGSYVREARKLVPALSPRDVTRGFSGTRAQAVDRDGMLVDDFVVHQTQNAIHVRNAPSPAATSSLAIARLIADQVDSAG